MYNSWQLYSSVFHCILCLCHVLLDRTGSTSNSGATIPSKAAAAVASYLHRNASAVYKRVGAETIANHQMAPPIQVFYFPPRHIGWLDCCTDLNSTVNCLCWNCRSETTGIAQYYSLCITHCTKSRITFSLPFISNSMSIIHLLEINIAYQ